LFREAKSRAKQNSYFYTMKSENKGAAVEEELEADVEKEPADEELELEAWDDTPEEEGGLAIDDEIGGYTEGVEDKLDKFSPEY